MLSSVETPPVPWSISPLYMVFGQQCRKSSERIIITRNLNSFLSVKISQEWKQYWIIIVGPPKIGLQLDFSAGINP